MRRFAYPVLVAALVAAVCASRVHLGFERVRFRIVNQPRAAVDSTLSVPLPDLARLSAAPAALVARVAGADGPVNIVVTLDAVPVARFAAPPRRESRVDAAFFVPAGAGHQLTFTADRPGWQLTYLELANVHGFSEGAISLVVAPDTRRHDARPPPWLPVALGVAAFALRPRPGWPVTRAGRAVSYGVSAGVIALFVIILLAPVFSPFLVLLSLRTFLLIAALLYVESIRRALSAGRSLRRFASLLPHAVVVAVFLWGLSNFYDRSTGFTSLIVFGEEFDERAAPALRAVPHPLVEGSGYDGQFYAQIALDPLLQDDATVAALDDAAYRSRRVLFPLAAHVLGVGRPALILQAYALLNVVAWLVLGWQLLRWLPPGSVRPTLAWAAIMLCEGLSASVTKALLEGPSLPLLAAGVVCVERNRPRIAAAVLGLSGLARETNLLASAMLVRPNGAARGWLRRSTTIGIVIAAPLAAWLIYLWSIGLPPIAMGGRNVMLPFVSYAQKWTVTIAELWADGWDSFARYSLLALVALTTQALTLVLHRESHRAWWRIGIAYAALMPLLGPAVWEGYPGAFPRALLPMSVAFNVLLPGSRWFWPLLVLGNANSVHALRELQLPWFSW